MAEAREGLERYFPFHNERRIHQSLDYHTSPRSLCRPLNTNIQQTIDRRGRELGLKARPPAHLTG